MNKSKVLPYQGNRSIFFKKSFRKFISVERVESIFYTLNFLREREIDVDWLDDSFFWFFDDSLEVFKTE
jgi:hypothetical protein